MPRTPVYEVHTEALLELLEDRALRLTDFQRATVEVDEERKGVSMALLSELMSGTRTHTSLRTIRLMASALGMRRPMALVRGGSQVVA